MSPGNVIKRVLVPLAEGCEELEAVTIVDLLRRGGIEVVVAGLREGTVTGSRGVRIVPGLSSTRLIDRPLRIGRLSAVTRRMEPRSDSSTISPSSSEAV